MITETHWSFRRANHSVENAVFILSCQKAMDILSRSSVQAYYTIIDYSVNINATKREVTPKPSSNMRMVLCFYHCYYEESWICCIQIEGRTDQCD